MLYAILQKIKERCPEAKLAMAPSGHAPHENRIRHGFLQKAPLWHYGFQWEIFASFIPKKIRD
jgi:hypothetical protein